MSYLSSHTHSYRTEARSLWKDGIDTAKDSYGSIWSMSRTQTLVQLTDRLLAALDQYAARVGRNRSEVIRSAIEHYLEESLEDDIDRAVVEGYKKKPQEPDTYVAAAARDAISAEPW